CEKSYAQVQDSMHAPVQDPMHWFKENPGNLIQVQDSYVLVQEFVCLQMHRFKWLCTGSKTS
ncbi:hypothetical protein A2U01_0067573, partial [Trifolium medium]|nr:hypothetical protein [Trifolium medium]